MRRWVAMVPFLLAAAPPERPTPNAPPTADAPKEEGERRAEAARAAADPGRLCDGGAAAFARAVDWSVLDAVAVQHGGRRKPLEAFARETLWGLLGRQSWKGQPPAMTVLTMAFDPAWNRAKVLKAGHPELAQALGGSRVSLEDLASEAFDRLWGAAQRQAPEERTALDRAVLDLERRGGLLLKVAEDLRVIPPKGSEESPWIGMGEEAASSAGPEAFNAFVEMEGAWRVRDAAAFTAASGRWAEALRALQPPTETLSLERLYYRVQPFAWASGLYAAAFAVLLLGWVRGTTTRAGAGLLAAACIAHGAGIAARVIISGRPPVSNMYEVVLYVSWAAAALSVLAEIAFKWGATGLPAAALGAVGLLAASFVPVLDPAISRVQAVLNNNYWLSVHVCTITTSYAILFLGFSTGVCCLFRQSEAADRAAYRLNQLGFLFLTAGTLTGAWWANESWGRYWGWDPKETGAFITWCVYAAYLHLRLFGFVKARGAAWLTVAGAAAILFTMVGVSYFLPGLHSYA